MERAVFLDDGVDGRLDAGGVVDIEHEAAATMRRKLVADAPCTGIAGRSADNLETA